jgi:hypothetical protein
MGLLKSGFLLRVGSVGAGQRLKRFQVSTIGNIRQSTVARSGALISGWRQRRLRVDT